MNTKNNDLQQLLNIEPTRNMSDKIYEQISALINNGTLEEGYTFPNETQLCAQLNVGRSSLREAYKALESNGFVTRTKRGTIVNSKTKIIGATPLKYMVENSNDHDFLEFRMLLEGGTAALAAQRATDEDKQKLQEICTRSEEAKNNRDYDTMAQLDIDFHYYIANATHNTLLISSMTALTEAWFRESKKNFYLLLANRPIVCSTMPKQHQGVLDAIVAGDAELAKKLMLEHIEYVS